MQSGQLGVSVGNMVFSGGTALAGLILVFLGAISNALQAYRPEQRDAARPIFRKRAVPAFVGFVLALGSALAGLLAVPFECDLLAVIGAVVLVVSFALTIVVAAGELREL